MDHFDDRKSQIGILEPRTPNRFGEFTKLEFPNVRISRPSKTRANVADEDQQVEKQDHMLSKYDVDFPSLAEKPEDFNWIWRKH